MFVTIGCVDATCKYNIDGNYCTKDIVQMDNETINNKVYVVCTSYEDKRKDDE